MPLQFWASDSLITAAGMQPASVVTRCLRTGKWNRLRYRRQALNHGAMPVHERLDCLKCPSLCCRMAGYVRVSRDDIRRLAKFLDLSAAEFEKRHIVETTRKGEKRIKQGFKTCQFLTGDRLCGVYEARPHDCRGYVCWNQDDETVYDYAAFLQTDVARLRDHEKDIKK